MEVSHDTNLGKGGAVQVRAFASDQLNVARVQISVDTIIMQVAWSVLYSKRFDSGTTPIRSGKHRHVPYVTKSSLGYVSSLSMSNSIEIHLLLVYIMIISFCSHIKNYFMK